MLNEHREVMIDVYCYGDTSAATNEESSQTNNSTNNNVQNLEISDDNEITDIEERLLSTSTQTEDR
jgi:hypothetical protein